MRKARRLFSPHASKAFGRKPKPTKWKDHAAPVSFLACGKSQLPLETHTDVVQQHSFPARIVFSTQVPLPTPAVMVTVAASAIHKAIQCSQFPKMNSRIGSFEEISSGLLELMNAEHTRFKSIAELMVGAIMHTSNVNMITTSCEVYARDASIDKHLQSNSTTFPNEYNADERRYKILVITVLEQTDGGKMISKLQLDTTK